VGEPIGQDMFQTSFSRAWNTHFCLPVAKSMATRLSLVPVAGGEVSFLVTYGENPEG